MAAIPLQKFREVEYPLTPKSTMHYWAVEGYYRNSGPLAGRVEKIGGRWYVKLSSDHVVSNIVNDIKEFISEERS